MRFVFTFFFFSLLLAGSAQSSTIEVLDCQATYNYLYSDPSNAEPGPSDRVILDSARNADIDVKDDYTRILAMMDGKGNVISISVSINGLPRNILISGRASQETPVNFLVEHAIEREGKDPIRQIQITCGLLSENSR